MNEDVEYVPRFNVKDKTHDVFIKFPINKELKYDRDLLVYAMQYGMILKIQYRGEDDNDVVGKKRIIYPMCLGTSAKGKPLLRAYHLKGWSLSNNGLIEKIWRMFRTDRILSMAFTGSFFRLAPEGYNALDKGMTGGITKSVDINEIQKKQQQLINTNVIQSKKEITDNTSKDKLPVIKIANTKSILDLNTPFDNTNIRIEDKLLYKITFLKSTTSVKTIAVLGALGKKDINVKLITDNVILGTYRVLKSVYGSELGKQHFTQIENISKFDLYLYIETLN